MNYMPQLLFADASNLYTYEGLLNIVNNLMTSILGLAWFVAGGVILWYGLKMVLARGDDKQFAEAKKGLTWAIIGALVMFGVWTIIYTLRAFVDSLG